MKRTLTYGAALASLCAALGLVTLSLSGCSTVANALNIVNPTYTIRDVRPHVSLALPLTASSIDFDFNVAVDNPNSVSLNLARLDFGILVNGNHVIDSFSSDRVVIPARGANDVHLRARVGYQQIPNLFNEIVNVVQGNRANYQVQGTAWFDTPAGQLHFPVNVAITR
ncbi:MAG TPA: LEA type 2 family protein [Thermoanaerobaculia bacterium]|nr:LEA type 2 family protein [Thermoanaerobaculia bacterium]